MKNSVAFVLQICLASFLAGIVLSQRPNCASKGKCDDCIRSYGCEWCSDPDFKNRRCYKAGDSQGCPPRYIMNPTIETTGMVAKNLSDVVKSVTNSGSGGGSNSITGSTSQDNIVQVTPQRINVNLRPNEGNPYRFKMWYKQARDYPVDLYYLMDLSNSMKDDKDKLSQLGNELAKEMKSLTSNFRLGFGSFVDKVVMPYVSIVPKNLNSPCDGCAAPYGYKNVMSLSQDTNAFSTQVKLANVSGNLDAPEGGFDAIMQAIVCKDQIGWRNEARKLLVFSTDSSFHYAGDGKLGGIVKPNDGCCHLDSSGTYTYSSIQDYPSVSQINTKVKEHSINMIFAVTADQIPLYDQLRKHIEGSSAGELSSDSSNVVKLVVDQYNKITSTVEMKEKDLLSNFRIKYFSRCLNPSGPLIETNKCDGLKVGQTVEFEIELELLSCPSNVSSHHFTVYPVGLTDSLTIDVRMLCDCECKYPGHPFYEERSAKCSGHGTLKCGMCDCDIGFTGDDCSCTSDADKTDECHPTNTTQLCSGRGSCKCNKCECESSGSNDMFYGKYCECNNFTCPRIGGVICSGHGDCICGKCQCHPGWIGEGCACEDSISNCAPPGYTDPKDICSGHGKCVCNKCECDQTGGYSGQYCNKCPTCNTKCNELKDCVQCKVHESGPYTKEKCDAECTHNITIVEYLKVADDDLFCSAYDDQDCRFTYIYEMVGNHISILAQKNKECPPQARIPGVVFSVILSIVLIGLAFLLMWKFITSMRDRREFAKFEKERMMAKWDAGQNPIYKQATSTFKNPMYCGS